MDNKLISVQQMINEAVEARSQSRGLLRDNNYFSVSDAGTCYRKRFFKRLGIQPQVPIHVGALRKMLAGDAGHEMLQATLKAHGTLFAAEGVIQTPHIKGHFDAIVKTETSKVLLEFKTVEKWGMTHIKKDGPKKEHMLQMFTYWMYLRPDYTQLDQATLFYVKREDFEGIEFNYLWDPEVMKLVVGEWDPLLDYWANQELPPCRCNEDFGGNGVKYCRYISEDGETCCDEKLLKKEEHATATNISNL